VKLFDFVDPDSQISFDSKIIYKIIKKEPVHFSGEYLAGTALVPVLD
jgi:hypothetical protein